MRRTASILTEDGSGSAVMTVYILPEDFKIPDDWQKQDMSAFVPSVPSIENADNLLDSLGIVSHGLGQGE
jgi:hypothetical protein